MGGEGGRIGNYTSIQYTQSINQNKFVSDSCRRLLNEQLCFGSQCLVLLFGEREPVPHVACLQLQLQLHVKAKCSMTQKTQTVYVVN